MVVAKGKSRFPVLLRAEDIAALDRLALEAGVSRSRYASGVLERYLRLTDVAEPSGSSESERPASSLAKVRAERQKQEDAWSKMKGGTS